MFKWCLIFILFAAPAYAQTETHTRIDHTLIGSLMVLQGTDISTSMYCIGARLCTEANPLLRPLQDTPVGFGVVKMSLAVVQSAVFLKLHAKHPRLVRWLTIASIGFYAYVVQHNARQILAREN